MEARTRVAVGYNAQIAVDTKHNLIAEQQVHSKVSDLGLLTETASVARGNLKAERMAVVADKGYFKIEDIEACEAEGVTPYVPKPNRSPARSAGRFPKSAFHYDKETDTYICPNGPAPVAHVRHESPQHAFDMLRQFPGLSGMRHTRAAARSHITEALCAT